MVTLEITRTLPLHPKGIFVQWTLKNPAESGTYKFFLYRSANENGPWETVVENLTDTYAFLDTFLLPPGLTTETHRRPNLMALTRTFVYRVICLPPTGEQLEAVSSVGPHFEQSPSGRKAAEHWRRGTKNFQIHMKYEGSPVAILKRKVWGERCPICTDKITRTPTRGACKVCYGNAFTGGYWNPVYVRIRRGAPNSVTLNTPEQKVDTNKVRIWLPGIPQVDVDDVLVFLRDNRRFKIDSHVQTEITLIPVHQLVDSVELERGHVVYQFKVSPDEAPLL
jgi:hypothetical protein